VQIHGIDADPIFVDEGDLDAARELVESADDAELSSTRVTSTTSPTAVCRATTRALPRSSLSGCSRSSTVYDAPPMKELEVR
jgi:hypothetical protein